jgi:hypothetical protein
MEILGKKLIFEKNKVMALLKKKRYIYADRKMAFVW